MAFSVYVAVQSLLLTFRFLLYPVFRVASFFSNWLFERLTFEWENTKSEYSQSFSKTGEVADVCFEVSSEGELEAVRPIIDSFLSANKKVEIIYSSPSLEDKCLSLAKKFQSIRIFRLPLLTYAPALFPYGQNINKFITAKTIFLCRYDFYPELISFCRRKGVQAVLVSASVKGKDISKYAIRFYLKQIFNSFSMIISSTEKDVELIKELSSNDKTLFYHYDFRQVQIAERLSKRLETLNRLPFYNEWEKVLEKYPKNRRIIFGNFWASESDCLKGLEEKSKDWLIVLAPHDLSLNNIKDIQNNLNLETTLIDKEEDFLANDFLSSPKIVLLTLPGILCEIYEDFGHTYVGGGHGRSIHSILEPYLAGCNIFCGPKVHRSTEYDFMLENTPDYLHIIKDQSQFHKNLEDLKDVQISNEIKENLIKTGLLKFKEMEEIIKNYWENHA